MLSRATFTAYIEGGVEDQRGSGMSFEECGITVDEKKGCSHFSYFKSHDRENSLAIPTMAKSGKIASIFSDILFYTLFLCVKLRPDKEKVSSIFLADCRYKYVIFLAFLFLRTAYVIQGVQ